MQRITISLDEALGEALDQMAQARGYGSRSEAMRDLVRDGLERWRGEDGQGSHCVANLSYVVDRRVRGLPQLIADVQHAHHDLIASSMIVRLDHDHSLETVVLQGSTDAVRAFADQVRSERGVRLGSLNMLAVTPTDDHHHEHDHQHRGHHHLSPLA
ncbi:MAG: nickel-responsive transcriptional regulator NikR [Sphingobium sp.]